MAKLTSEQRAKLVARARRCASALTKIAESLEKNEAVPPCFDSVSVANPLNDIESTLEGRVDGWKAIAFELGVSLRTVHRLVDDRESLLPVFHDRLGVYAWVAQLRSWMAVEKDEAERARLEDRRHKMSQRVRKELNSLAKK